ncbi:hypothetical protein V1L52_00475 [Treponema sp. HNW]|uniref:hypothetical protein n=1 Tax=Treponema sp. HNW TaxID=3116654 RepID=UPI003D0EDDCA
MEKHSFQTATHKLIAGILIFIGFLSFYFAAELYAEHPDTIKIFNSDECDTLLSGYYGTGKIDDEDIKTLTEGINFLADSLDKLVFQDKKSRDIKEQNKLLILYLEHAEIISTIYNYEGMNYQDELIKKTDTDLKRFLTLSDLEGEVYLKYADYLYTKLSHSKTKRFNINLTLPVLYRRALAKDKKNKTALVKLSCWQISSADEVTSNFNSQIRATEKYIETLNEVDKFNAYIRYSVFYMKIYDTQKGWEYFYKAKNLFPSHPLLPKLYENYHKGRFKTGV